MERIPLKLLLWCTAFVTLGLGSSGCDEFCSGDKFECLKGGKARTCVDGRWQELGTCYLGCNPAQKMCFVPSNIPQQTMPNVLLEGLAPLDLASVQSPVTINSDDGSISDTAGTNLRFGGLGLQGGVLFSQVPQPDDPTRMVAVFTMRSLNVPAGMTLIGKGSLPIILYVREDVFVDGAIDVGARHGKANDRAAGDHAPGAGGFAGGTESLDGEGPGAGLGGDGVDCGDCTTSGGGGGGHVAEGGEGGDGSDPYMGCDDLYKGGEGGLVYGTVELRPLIGGSGGGGGGEAVGDTSNGGQGGAGGGGIQITALTSIRISNGGAITAPGGGGAGGDLDCGGGGGGGSGGAILLEAPVLLMGTGSVLAVNGGGGGSGDYDG